MAARLIRAEIRIRLVLFEQIDSEMGAAAVAQMSSLLARAAAVAAVVGCVFPMLGVIIHLYGRLARTAPPPPSLTGTFSSLPPRRWLHIRMGCCCCDMNV